MFTAFKKGFLAVHKGPDALGSRSNHMTGFP
jgi:hypothetical protein